MPKISVVMPTYNAEKYIKEAIDSILLQTYKNFELLVIDDNSKDSTLDILKSYDDERIKVIQGDCEGLAAALNKGIREAKGEYIARMDADDVSLPERFEKQVKFLEEHPDISLVGSWQKYIGNDNKIHKTLQTPDEVKIAMLFGCDLCHSTIMFKKKDFVDNNLFYDISSPQEDFELWSRAVHILKFANLQEILGLYRVTGESVTDNKVNIIEDYEVKIVLNQLDKYLHITVSDIDKELFRCRSNLFYSKDLNSKKDFLCRLDLMYKKIEEQNKKYKVYNPDILHNFLIKTYTAKCHGFYLLYRSGYLRFNIHIILFILSKFLKTNVCLSEKFSIIQIFGIRFYKKYIENDKFIKKYLGIVKIEKKL